MGVNRKLPEVICVVYALSADCLQGVALHSGGDTHRQPDIAASTVVM